MLLPPLDSLAGALLGAAPSYLPAPASSAAAELDALFWFVAWVCAFFLGLIIALVIAFVLKYRRRASRPEPEPSPDRATGLELLWTVIPLAIVIVMFAWSAQAYVKHVDRPSDPDALQVQVLGRRWSWWFDHPTGKGSPELHLVAGRTTELVMSSADVLHSFYVPEFRLKQDVVPGRFTRMTLTPTVAGTFQLLCTEYCGTRHSQMNALVVVHPDQASFDAWLREGRAPDDTLAALGQAVCLKRGCNACHTVSGARSVGPTFKGMWGRTEKLVGGGEARVDEAYVRESLLQPKVKLVEGFPPVMPPAPMEERELLGVIEYLKTLQ